MTVVPFSNNFVNHIIFSVARLGVAYNHECHDECFPLFSYSIGECLQIDLIMRLRNKAFRSSTNETWNEMSFVSTH